jgi:hypothetical protein
MTTPIVTSTAIAGTDTFPVTLNAEAVTILQLMLTERAAADAAAAKRESLKMPVTALPRREVINGGTVVNRS